MKTDDARVIEKDTDFAMHIGVGARFRLGDSFGLRLDGRLLWPPSIDADGPQIGVVDWELGFGVWKSFDFSATAKPATPKRIAPVPVPIITDSKPAVPPPPADKDLDGIPDDKDACADTVEDRDGDRDEDGCPDIDADSDGVDDASDKCVGQAETRNEYQDDDGCPDEVPAPVKQFTGQLPGVAFGKDSDVLAKSSYASLDQVAKAMAEFPTLKIAVGGHTDTTGREANNVALSQSRADAVVRYLVAKGIPAQRLRATGYGSSQPIADNLRTSGRRQNRRVELKVLP